RARPRPRERSTGDDEQGGRRMTPSLLARRNPTVKFALLFVVSFGVLVLFDPLPVLALYVLASIAALTAARVPLRTFVVGQLPFLAFAIGIVSVNALSRPGV